MLGGTKGNYEDLRFDDIGNSGLKKDEISYSFGYYYGI
jgi:hypothetical protein